MFVTRGITHRLYRSRQQEQKLFYWRRLQCLLFDARIANPRTQCQKFGKCVDYFKQQNCLPQFKKVWTQYQEINSQALQTTSKQLDSAYKSFYN